jgi:hypothetical protein
VAAGAIEAAVGTAAKVSLGGPPASETTANTAAKSVALIIRIKILPEKRRSALLRLRPLPPRNLKDGANIGIFSRQARKHA